MDLGGHYSASGDHSDADGAVIRRGLRWMMHFFFDFALTQAIGLASANPDAGMRYRRSLPSVSRIELSPAGEGVWRAHD